MTSLKNHGISKGNALELELVALATKFDPAFKDLRDNRNLNDIVAHYMKEYNDNVSTYVDTSYRRDVRTNEEKLVNLLLGFSLEDMSLYYLSKVKNIAISNNQSYSGRTIQNLSNIVENDFQIHINSTVYDVEFKTIATKIEESSFRIKESNWNRYKKERVLILGYEIQTNRMFFLNPNDTKWKDRTPEPFFGFGGKLCYVFKDTDFDFIPLSKISLQHFKDQLT